MPRPLRVHVPGGFYHVTLRGNHQQAIFVVESDRRLLNTIVARVLESTGSRLHAYCWMTNHLHLLMQVHEQPLAVPMRAIASEFARAMQEKLATTGHYFERRYHARLVDADSYFLRLLRYIHLNPVSACMVKRPELFAWSSHHVYSGARNEPWVTTDFGLRMFGQNRRSAIAAYLRFVASDDAMDWTPDAIESAPELAADELVLPRASDRIVKRQTLAQLIAEACQRFAVAAEMLESPVRDKYLSKVRAWIAHQAAARHVCALAAVARSLNRHESTLREAMRRYPREIK